MRIAIVAPPWVSVPPPSYGGTETVLDGLAKGLVAAGHEVLLYTTGDSTCPVPRAWVLEKAAGVGTAGSATELRHVVNAYETLRVWKPDVVHDHTLIGPVYAGRFAELVLVTTNHGPFQSELGDYYRAVSPTVAVIAISAHQASTAVDTRIHAVIHHGVDTEAFRAGPGDGGFALFLGRMCEEKGAHVAAAAARAAGVPLLIAAKAREPREQEFLGTVVQPLLGDGIEYVGEVGTTDKIDLLGRARCLLNPINWPEPFGMVMIEALACGTPVVARPCGAAPELVDHGRTGFLCDTEADLVDALGRVGEIDRAGCRAAVVERFSISRMVSAHVEAYRAAIARHEVPAPDPVPAA